jgi:hypothetical protein
MKNFEYKDCPWCSLLIHVFLLTIFCGLCYFLIQQDLRQSANDPQIQMAEDQVQPENLPSIDISKSLAPFVIVFDEKGNPISSSGTLNGVIPTIPAGVFVYVRTSGGGDLRPTDIVGEDRFTWQPENGVRIAAVVVRTNSGFILAGRNLREIEKREENALFVSGIAWIFGIVGLFVIEALATVYTRGI